MFYENYLISGHIGFPQTLLFQTCLPTRTRQNSVENRDKAY